MGGRKHQNAKQNHEDDQPTRHQMRKMWPHCRMVRNLPCPYDMMIDRVNANSTSSSNYRKE